MSLPLEQTHLEFLKDIADYGHGVFVRTMFHPDRMRRKSLVSWLKAHPEFVETIDAPNNSPSLHVLTPEGMKHFSAQSSLTKSTTVHGLTDILILNAYVFEMGAPFLLPYSVDRTWTLESLKVGLVSTRYGMPLAPETFDRLLILPKSRQALPSHLHHLPFYTPAALLKVAFP